MATSINQLAAAVVLLGLIIMMLNPEFTVAKIGVCYGTLGDNLPSPTEVVALYKKYNIQRMKIYNPDESILKALNGSDIELILGVPNSELEDLAFGYRYASSWVQKNIINYPNIQFRYISVGNEVNRNGNTSQYVGFVLPALQKIYNAISAAGLNNQIKVSTSIETGILGKTFPPIDGEFNDVAKEYMSGIIEFLVNTSAPLLVNIYPYFTYIGNQQDVDIQYALFESEGFDVPGGVRYQSLFYAMLDALYAALVKSGGSSLEMVVSETGWPSAGGDAASLNNSRIYNTNLIQRVSRGTLETYIFAMFDENQRVGDGIVNHFGIFTPSGQSKYPISFN